MAYFQVRTVSFRECRECNINSRWWQLKYCLYICSSLFGENEPNLTSIIFQMGWFNRQLAIHLAAHHFFAPWKLIQVVASIAEGAVAPMVYELSAVAKRFCWGSQIGSGIQGVRFSASAGCIWGDLWMNLLNEVTVWVRKSPFECGALWNGMSLWFLRRILLWHISNLQLLEWLQGKFHWWFVTAFAPRLWWSHWHMNKTWDVFFPNILLMEEIPNNHLGYVNKPVNNGISTTYVNWCLQDFWTINSMIFRFRLLWTRAWGAELTYPHSEGLTGAAFSDFGDRFLPVGSDHVVV